MLIRGYETRRTDSFPSQVEALEEVFSLLMKSEIDGALQLSKDWVTKISKGEVEKDTLVISKTVNLKRK